MPDSPNNFEIRNMTLRIAKDRNSKCRKYNLYIQGILYLKKENM